MDFPIEWYMSREKKRPALSTHLAPALVKVLPISVDEYEWACDELDATVEPLVPPALGAAMLVTLCAWLVVSMFLRRPDQWLVVMLAFTGLALVQLIVLAFVRRARARRVESALQAKASSINAHFAGRGVAFRVCAGECAEGRAAAGYGMHIVCAVARATPVDALPAGAVPLYAPQHNAQPYAPQHGDAQPYHHSAPVEYAPHHSAPVEYAAAGYAPVPVAPALYPQLRASPPPPPYHTVPDTLYPGQYGTQ